MSVKLAPRVSRYCPILVKGKYYGLECTLADENLWSTDSVGNVKEGAFPEHYAIWCGEVEEHIIFLKIRQDTQ